ncbi:hypothetical protein B9Z55_006810 [Caenorhabditis nigoni]|uniref:BED-type domain-containing protein n=1 Tax=Caenorhabditis nigoni TaxID=1611254 RepID=A0A2G5TT66_9PELO|nr:hypothetical protein B9Z55_027242 [Caenorhabditis nigoni]PIC29773.1 hypothetical protein B9Z55_021256 [Caenorhabditis nigoni]PIC30499.1 hypothetical protein B9Z55_021716 [Caenorhabditis nigoni]PIC38311.1 hypothetical protein B9Z55_010361 [Caenorhabditis nigoni]PIC47458.1 hypothetical protein B9Z55_006810 [Caenorhabditis nigoni]
MSDEGSIAWRFFMKSNDLTQVTCRRCQKSLKFSGSTSGMIHHVRTVHTDELKTLQAENPDDFLRSQRANALSCENLNELLVLAMATGNVSFRFVNNRFFRKFVKELNPEYRLIGPDSIRRKLRKNCEQYIKETINELESLEKCFLSMDGWDGKYENVSLYALFVYFIDKKFRKKRVFLGIRSVSGKATAENVGDLITEILSNYKIKISSVIGAVCDGGSNLKSFLQKNNLYHLHCCAHSLALILKNLKVKAIEEVLEKVNKLAARLSRSKNDRRLFRERSKALRTEGRIPLQFCITRWGGQVLLAISYLNHYQSISAINNFQQYLLTDAEKKILEEFVSLTTPFAEAISRAEADDTYSSEIIPQFASLHAFISSQDSSKKIVRVLKNETQFRYKQVLGNEIALMAVFCDPRFSYMKGLLLDTTWEDVESLVELYCDSFRVIGNSDSSPMSPPEKKQKSTDSFFSKYIESKRESTSLQTAKNEIVSFEALLVSARPPISSSPLSFWETNRNRFPKLSMLARHVLCSPQSSAQVERLFSKCGQIVSSTRRNRLSTETLNDLLLNAFLADSKIHEEDEDSSDDEQADLQEDFSGMWPTAKKRRQSSVPRSVRYD